jgi:hypothetical protein
MARAAINAAQALTRSRPLARHARHAEEHMQQPRHAAHPANKQPAITSARIVDVPAITAAPVLRSYADTRPEADKRRTGLHSERRTLRQRLPALALTGSLSAGFIGVTADAVINFDKDRYANNLAATAAPNAPLDDIILPKESPEAKPTPEVSGRDRISGSAYAIASIVGTRLAGIPPQHESHQGGNAMTVKLDTETSLAQVIVETYAGKADVAFSVQAGTTKPGQFVDASATYTVPLSWANKAIASHNIPFNELDGLVKDKLPMHVQAGITTTNRAGEESRKGSAFDMPDAGNKGMYTTVTGNTPVSTDFYIDDQGASAAYAEHFSGDLARALKEARGAFDERPLV